MAKWRTKDISRFTHNEDPNSTIIGDIECLLCSWMERPNSPSIFPTVDDEVEEHVKHSHPEVLNAAGIQRTPTDDALVYYVILNP